MRTEHQGQARELMAVMDKTDGVVVAGGDGLLSEVMIIDSHVSIFIHKIRRITIDGK